MLSFTPDAINEWLFRQPGGRHALERGLASDVMPHALLALERLAAALEGVNQTDPGQLERRLADSGFQTSLRTLTAHLSLARRYRLIAWIADANLTNGDQVLRAMLDPQTPPAGSGAALHADIMRQHRLGLLDAIFDPERIQRVQVACHREVV